MTARPRVLVVLNGADDTFGGSIRAAVNTAEAMARAGADVTFTAPVPPQGVPTRTLDAARGEIDVELFRATRPVARFGGSMRQIVWLVRNIRSFDAVQVHTSFYAAVLYTALICRIAKVPFYLWPHGGLLDYDMRQHRRVKEILGRVVWRPMLASCTALLCTTQREARELRTFGANPPRHVVSLPITPIADAPMPRDEWRAAYGIAPDAFVALFFGRVAPKKRLDLAVEALAHLPADVVLAVVGAKPSPRLDELRRRAEALGVGDRLRIIEWVEGAARAGAFSAADCFVLPSDNENFGMATAEALLMRLPVVISTEVFISEELSAVDGAIVADRDPVAVAAGIATLRKDPAAAAAMAERARELALDLYDVDRVGARILTSCHLGSHA